MYASAADLRACEVEYCKQHLSTKARLLHRGRLEVCYRNHLTVNGARRTHFVFVQAWLDGSSADAYRASKAIAGTATDFGPSVVHLREHDAIAWSFPNDPALPQLADVTSAARAAERFPRLVPDAACRANSQALRVAPTVIRYKPAHHCLTRHDVRAGRAASTAVFAKTYSCKSGTGAKVYERMGYFAERFAAKDAALTTARPLWLDTMTNTVWQTAVAGTPVAQMLRSADNARLMAAAARAIATVHTSKPPCGGEITVADLMHETTKKLAKLRLMMPSEPAQRDLDAIGRYIDTTTPAASRVPRGPIHGDFHVGQLMAGNDRLALLDFDDVATGDPHQDLAEFMVDLHFRGLPSQTIKLLKHSLWRAYVEATSAEAVEFDPSIEQLRWHARVQCIEKAYHLYSSYAPDRERASLNALEVAKTDPCAGLT